MEKLEKYKQERKIRVLYNHDKFDNFLMLPQYDHSKMENPDEAFEVQRAYLESIEEQIEEFDGRRKIQSFSGALISKFQT